MKPLITVDLTNENELLTLWELVKNNKAQVDKFIENGRTAICYDHETGDILMAVQNGKAISTSNENIKFKSILHFFYI